jgi:hypothetical protein
MVAAVNEAFGKPPETLDQTYEKILAKTPE